MKSIKVFKVLAATLLFFSLLGTAHAVGRELPLAESLLSTYGLEHQKVVIKDVNDDSFAFYSCSGEIRLGRGYYKLPWQDRVKTIVHELLHAVDTRICYEAKPLPLESFTDYIAKRIVDKRYDSWRYSYGYDVSDFSKYDNLPIPDVMSIYMKYGFAK